MRRRLRRHAALGGGDPGTRAPSGSTVAFEKTTLWVGYEQQISAFSTNGNGAVTPAKTYAAFRWSNSIAAPFPGIVDIAIAPDGTQYLLENRSAAEGGPGWRLYAVAPGDNQPENTYGDDVNRPIAVGLGGDGIQVAYSDNRRYDDDRDVSVRREQRAADTHAADAPARCSGSTKPPTDISTSCGPNHVDVYDQFANGSGPVRSINLTGLTGHVSLSSTEFAVAPNNTIYVVDLPGNNANRDVRERVPAGVGQGGAAHRTAAADYSGFGFPVITVDSLNRLYVATNGQFYRFGPNAQGADAPQRLMTDSTQSRVHALAVGPKL